MFDQGHGPPVVVIPGLHGRWEWATPALRELARRCRTISYSLCGDVGSRFQFDRTIGFDSYVRQLDEVLDKAGLERAAICGISFGGFVALRYAASRPDRVSALVLSSAPGPGWKPTAQQAKWIAKPWLSAPAFVLSSPFRLWPEISAAFPDGSRRIGFLIRQGLRCAAFPMIPSLMAARIRMVGKADFTNDCGVIRAATLIMTGEDSLDRVVPVPSTRAYASYITGAQYLMLQRTGHIGSLTQPGRFAEVVSGFVHANNQ